MTHRIERSLRVRGREGLHARPAARIVETARKFSATLTLSHGNLKASAKDLMDLLYLAAPGGCELVLVAEGEDAVAAVAAIVTVFEQSAEET